MFEPLSINDVIFILRGAGVTLAITFWSILFGTALVSFAASSGRRLLGWSAPRWAPFWIFFVPCLCSYNSCS